jgi:hypothetical protein
MARTCKCQITHEIGDVNTFIKIDGKYYKSQEIYDEYKKNANLHRIIVDTIVNDFLNYQKGQIFPTILTKKLKELEFYPNEVIFNTIKKNHDTIQYWMNTKDFNSDIGKISYIFAIIKGNINDIYKQWKIEQNCINKKNNNDTNLIIDINMTENKHEEKDLRKWLEDDEWN